MKTYFYAITLAAFTFASQQVNAQSAPQTVIGSAGAFATFANGSMSWTLGEVMTETYAGSGNFFTQGFNQPDTMYLTVIPEPSSQNFSIYPNPVVDNLVIDLSQVSGNYSMEIFNMQGQLLQKNSIAANQKQLHISFREFANGVYLIHITDTRSGIRTSYKINKSE